MSSEQPRRARESTGSPLGSTAAIIIAIVAVVAGFLILKQIRDDDDSSTSVDDPTDESVTDDSAVDDTLPTDDTSGTTPVITVESTVAVETTPTTVQVFEGAIVVVANASTVNGAAGQLTTALTGAGFDLSAATNATVKIDVSRVYYDPSNAQALSVAQTVATMMGIAEVLPVEAPAPIEGGALPEGVTVLVMLGSDKAGKTLEQMSAPATETTVAGTADTTTTTTG